MRMHKRFGGFWSNGQLAFAEPNTAGIPEKPSGNGSIRIVVQRIMDSAVLPHTVPAFPDGGGAVLHRIKPAGGGILQKEPVGSISMTVVGKHPAEERRCQEARIQMVAVVSHHLRQLICRCLGLRFLQESKRNGPDEFRLTLGGNHTVFGTGITVGIPGPLRNVLISSGILGFPQNIRDPGNQTGRLIIVGCGHLGSAEHHVLLHGVHAAHIRLQPFPKMEALIHKILFIGIPQILNPGFLGTSFHEG